MTVPYGTGKERERNGKGTANGPYRFDKKTDSHENRTE